MKFIKISGGDIISRNKESLQHQFERSINNAFKPGHSKRSDRHNVFGHAESKIYSYASKKELMTTAYDFSRFLKNNYPQIKNIVDITQPMVQKFIDSKAETGCTKTTVKQYISRMNKLCIISSNMIRSSLKFSDNLSVPRTDKDNIRNVVMTESDYRRIIDTNTKSAALIAFKLSYHLGLRVSECSKLKIRDIKKNEIDILRSKGGKSRTVPITTPEQKAALKEFENYCKQNGRDCLGIKPDSINKWCNRRMNELGLTKYLEARSSIHACRKAYAERTVQNIALSNSCSYRKAFHTVSVYLGHGPQRDELFKVYCPDLH